MEKDLKKNKKQKNKNNKTKSKQKTNKQTKQNKINKIKHHCCRKRSPLRLCTVVKLLGTEDQKFW